MKISYAMILSLTMFSCVSIAGADATIVGTSAKTWKEKQTTVKIGDVVTWKIEGGTHGVIFDNGGNITDKDAEQVLEIDKKASMDIKDGPSLGFPAGSKGTDPTSGTDTVIVTAKVVAIPAGITEVNFTCTQHLNMKGKLILSAGSGGGNAKPDKAPK